MQVTITIGTAVAEVDLCEAEHLAKAQELAALAHSTRRRPGRRPGGKGGMESIPVFDTPPGVPPKKTQARRRPQKG